MPRSGLGSRLLNNKRVELAIPVFERNIRDYPESLSAYDGLSEAFIAAGNTSRRSRTSRQPPVLCDAQPEYLLHRLHELVNGIRGDPSSVVNACLDCFPEVNADVDPRHRVLVRGL